MVNLNKGATVELVKALSDDIRTLPDGTKAASAGEAVRNIENNVAIFKNAFTIRTPQLYNKNNANYINAYVVNNVVTSAPAFESFVIEVEPNKKYTMSREHGTWTRWQADLAETQPEIDSSVTRRVMSGSVFNTNNNRDYVGLETRDNDHYLICYYYNQNTDSDKQALRDSICVAEGDDYNYYPYATYGVSDQMLSETMQEIPERVTAIENSSESAVRNIENNLIDFENAFTVRTPQLFDKDNATYISAYVANGVVTSAPAFESFVIAVEPNTHYTMSREHGTWKRWQCDLLETAPEIGSSTTRRTQSGTIFNTANNRDYSSFTTQGNEHYLICYYYNENTDADKETLRDSICIVNGDDYNYYPYITYGVSDQLLSETMQDVPNRVAALENASEATDKFSENNDLIVLGDEQLSDTGWSSDGWSGSVSTGFTHIAGETASLTNNLVLEANKYYLVSLTLSETGRVVFPSDFYITIGDSDVFETYTGIATNKTYVYALKTNNTNGLVITPRAQWEGTITNISIKRILSDNFPYALHWKDSSRNISYEVRTGTHENHNTFTGVNSGLYNFVGYENTGYGDDALASNDSGFWNTAVGRSALKFNTTGSRNIAIGYIAMQNNKTGARNVAVGTFALLSNTTGNHNIGIGADSLQYVTTGERNIALGITSGYGIVTGNDNICIGDQTLYNSTNATQNVAIGFQSGYYNVPTRSVGVGYEALRNGASYNVAIGWRAGRTATGNNNIFIGAQADTSVANVTNAISIGRDTLVDKSNQTVIGNTNTTETKIYGDLIAVGSDGIARRVVFNQDNTCSWEVVQ